MKQMGLVVVVVVVLRVLSDTSQSLYSRKQSWAAVCIGIDTKIEQEIKHGKWPLPDLLLFTRVRLFVTPWTAAHQASQSFTISWSLFRLMSIESMMSAKDGRPVLPVWNCLYEFLCSFKIWTELQMRLAVIEGQFHVASYRWITGIKRK